MVSTSKQKELLLKHINRGLKKTSSPTSVSSLSIIWFILPMLIACGFASTIIISYSIYNIFTKQTATLITESTTTMTTATTATISTTSTTMTSSTTFAFSNSEIVFGIWNTTTGTDSIPSTNGTGMGQYYPSEIPSNACDNSLSTSYTNFGTCNLYYVSITCGENTGFYVTPQYGSSLIRALQICTGPIFPVRDPMTITLEGSNQPASSLTLGSSWTLIYNGTSGLDTDPGRRACGVIQNLTSNSVWYANYRFLVTSKRGIEAGTWYSEVRLIS